MPSGSMNLYPVRKGSYNLTAEELHPSLAGLFIWVHRTHTVKRRTHDALREIRRVFTCLLHKAVEATTVGEVEVKDMREC